MMGLFLVTQGGSLAWCVGEAKSVGMSWCSLSYTVCWTLGHPILIRFVATTICPSSMINPHCYRVPTGRQRSVFSTLCILFLPRHSFKDLLRFWYQNPRSFFILFYFYIFCVIEKHITKGKIEEKGSELLAKWSMSRCLGNSRGYVRHCCRKTGKVHWQRLNPVPICHRMLNSSLYISYSYTTQLPRCYILGTVYFALFNSTVDTWVLVSTTRKSY